MSPRLPALILLIAGSASAGELQFTPDRPGIGDSTGTVGSGHVMVEGAFAGAIANWGPAWGTSGIIGRFGLTDPTEIRVRIPDVDLSRGSVGGNVGLGAKVALPLSDGIGFSVVPELLLSIPGSTPGVSVGGNLGFSADTIWLWVHGTVQYQQALSGLVGGGVSAPVGNGGLYLNGGVAPGGFMGILFGGGGWVGFGKGFQMDAGLDVMLVGSFAVLMPAIGASGGF